jgi:hypothetical protein
MEFNEHWTKKDNDLMRQMIKEKKSTDEIINFFGEDKVKYHPKGKFSYGKVLPYKSFLNEIKIRPEEVHFDINRQKSPIDNTKYDYMLTFDINEHKYLIILFYHINNNIESYNIFFTTMIQYIKYQEYISQISKGKDEDYTLSKEEFKNVTDILEKETEYNELFPIMKRLSFVLFSFSPTIFFHHPHMLFSLSNTNHPVKIRLYRDIIKNSFKNVDETISTDEQGNPFYYYKINDKI